MGIIVVYIGFSFVVFAILVIIAAVMDEHRVIYEAFLGICFNATMAYLLFRQSNVNMRQAEQI